MYTILLIIVYLFRIRRNDMQGTFIYGPAEMAKHCFHIVFSPVCRSATELRADDRNDYIPNVFAFIGLSVK